MFRFTIRDVLWLTVVVGLAIAWWIEHRQIAPLQKRCARLETLARRTIPIMRDLGIDAEFTSDNIAIGGSYWPPERAPWNDGKRPSILIESLPAP
jgi:hypothetical protein